MDLYFIIPLHAFLTFTCQLHDCILKYFDQMIKFVIECSSISKVPSISPKKGFLVTEVLALNFVIFERMEKVANLILKAHERVNFRSILF